MTFVVSSNRKCPSGCFVLNGGVCVAHQSLFTGVTVHLCAVWWSDTTWVSSSLLASSTPRASLAAATCSLASMTLCGVRVAAALCVLWAPGLFDKKEKLHGIKKDDVSGSAALIWILFVCRLWMWRWCYRSEMLTGWSDVCLLKPWKIRVQTSPKAKKTPVT